MHRFFKRKTPEPEEQNIGDVTVGEFDFSQLPVDPGLRIPICSYNANIRDQVRRIYLQKGPFQPSGYEFPKRKFGVSQFRRFNPSWFKEFGDWLEYSIEKDAAYCLYCYLFKTTKGKQARGETFVSEGFTNWKGAHNKEINDVILKNAPKNCKLASPDIQKDIVRACASETINVIIKDIGNSLFSILVDKSCDVSMKEQMSVVLRYVDSSGHVNECFIGIEHVTSTTTLSLKAAIDKMFSKYNLSIANVRGQGFDGTSNMQGKFNGLKALILKENPCAFYIHCFAHQLQLALIAVAKKNLPISNFFRIVGDVVNVVGSSCKRSDLLKEKHSDFIVEALERDEISSGRGLNQETTLQRAGDTRWGSHYNSLISLISMFSAVSDVLEVISEDDSSSPDQKTEAFNLLESILSFDFAFNLHLMKHVLGISSELSTTLQKKDQDIVNAMDLVQKKLLQLAEFYPQDFSRFDLLVLDDQLETYICDMRSNKTFQGLKDLSDLSEKLVMSKKNFNVDDAGLIFENYELLSASHSQESV
ncbi:zinc finger MYM-type protein 1-like [Zingiber officinale]|uniref:zinc finger MYM-type protein 1-like n=1 Tax=Zingiber officinale TaxID=94328 RepID=UPI001C4D0AC7|nr:zinc finger MYM-type protein 1-like [Zingiber officinale]